MEGDRQHQGNGEDKLSIHRHQSANLQRKKANVADQLQATKQELDGVESILAGKKREITEKSGREEVVSSVQVTQDFIRKYYNLFLVQVVREKVANQKQFL